MQNKAHNDSFVVEHQTPIGLCRAFFNAWRNSKGWSFEKAWDHVVEAHESLPGSAATGVVFDPKTQDPVERMEVNGDRGKRWLDDESKSTNLMSVNFFRSFLKAFPLRIRAELVAEYLRPIELGVCVLEAPTGALSQLQPLEMLKELMSDSSDAEQAVAALIDGATSDELARAATKLRETRDSCTRALNSIELTLRARALRTVK